MGEPLAGSIGYGCGGGLIDQLGDFGFVVESDLHPHIFESVGDLAKEFMNGLQARYAAVFASPSSLGHHEKFP
jgi:hypothetical protein